MVWQADLLESGSDAAAQPDCPAATAPAVLDAGRARLVGLRADLRQAIGTWAAGAAERSKPRPYEEGVVTGAAAWTDTEPGTGGVPAAATSPAGYEIRWWTWGWGWNNVATDVFLFRGPSEAERFLDLAASTECRTMTTSEPATAPPGAIYLEWSNPYDHAQQDVFLRRGSRVYRVAVVQPGVGPVVPEAQRREGFRFVSEVACGLPEAGCGGDRRQVVVVEAGGSSSGPSTTLSGSGISMSGLVP